MNISVCKSYFAEPLYLLKPIVLKAIAVDYSWFITKLDCIDFRDISFWWKIWLERNACLRCQRGWRARARDGVRDWWGREEWMARWGRKQAPSNCKRKKNGARCECWTLSVASCTPSHQLWGWMTFGPSVTLRCAVLSLHPPSWDLGRQVEVSAVRIYQTVWTWRWHTSGCEVAWKLAAEKVRTSYSEIARKGLC